MLRVIRIVGRSFPKTLLFDNVVSEVSLLYLQMVVVLMKSL